MKSASPWPLGIRTSGLGPAARRDRVRDGLEQSVIATQPRCLSSAALEVELLLDLVAAGVGNLVAEIAQLGEIAPERAVGDSCLVSELERVQTRLGDDRGEHPEQPSQTLSPIHRLTRPLGARQPRNRLAFCASPQGAAS